MGYNLKIMKRRLTYAMAGGASGSFIGPIHRMAIRMDALADLVAGTFSRDSKKNAASGKEFGIEPSRVYADWRSLINAERGKIDFLTICTTNESHYEIAKAALEAGIDVFCEKPLSLTLSEAEELGAIAKKHKRILGIPFTYTGYPMVKLARDLVKKGTLGKIDKIVLEYQQGSFRKRGAGGRPWKMDPKIAGPSCVVSDIGVHAFTMIEYVTGLEIKTLLADLSTYGNDAGLDDDASILMRLSAGAKAALVTSKVATGEENGVRLRVYGRKASLYWDQESPNYLSVKYPDAPERIWKRRASYVRGASAGADAASRFPAGHPEGFVEALASVYDEFVAAVKTRKARDFPGPIQGIRSMKFVEAALESSAKGSVWVKI